jgi:hypothetical protein
MRLLANDVGNCLSCYFVLLAASIILLALFLHYDFLSRPKNLGQVSLFKREDVRVSLFLVTPCNYGFSLRFRVIKARYPS